MRVDAYLAIIVSAVCSAAPVAIGKALGPTLADTAPVTTQLPAAGKLGAEPPPSDPQVPNTDDGVIRPPPYIDREFVKPAPPVGSNMPVIPPVATPPGPEKK